MAGVIPGVTVFGATGQIIPLDYLAYAYEYGRVSSLQSSGRTDVKFTATIGGSSSVKTPPSIATVPTAPDKFYIQSTTSTPINGTGKYDYLSPTGISNYVPYNPKVTVNAPPSPSSLAARAQADAIANANRLALETAAMSDYRELEKKQREARNLAEAMLKANRGVGTIVTVAGLAQYKPSASYNAAVDEQRNNFQKQYGGIIKTGPDTYKYVNADSLSSGYSCDKIFTDNAEINGGSYYAEKTRGQCIAYQSNLKYWDDFAKAEAQKAKERDARLAAEAAVFQKNQEALGFAKPAVVATTTLEEKKLIAATDNDIGLNALAAAASRKAAQDAILKAAADLKNLTVNKAVPDSKTGVDMVSAFVALKLLDDRGAIEKDKKRAAAEAAARVKTSSPIKNKLAKPKGSSRALKQPLKKPKK